MYLALTKMSPGCYLLRPVLALGPSEQLQLQPIASRKPDTFSPAAPALLSSWLCCPGYMVSLGCQGKRRLEMTPGLRVYLTERLPWIPWLWFIPLLTFITYATVPVLTLSWFLYITSAIISTSPLDCTFGTCCSTFGSDPWFCSSLPPHPLAFFHLDQFPDDPWLHYWLHYYCISTTATNQWLFWGPPIRHITGKPIPLSEA